MFYQVWEIQLAKVMPRNVLLQIIFLYIIFSAINKAEYENISKIVE